MNNMTNPKFTPVRAINWNIVPDEMDKISWETIKSQIWYPDELPITPDKPSWRRMSQLERDTLVKCFAGLTRLDSLQTMGMATLIQIAQTQHEEGVLAFFAAFEAIHASSYSFINQTLLSADEEAAALDWADHNELLTAKITLIQAIYEDLSDDPLLPYKKRVMSTLLESMAFFTGFYYPLHLAGHGKMSATADLVRLIIRDETQHGGYISYKARQLFDAYTPEQQEECTEFVYTMLADLMDNERQYSIELYGELGLVEEANAFLDYNASKTLQSLGFPMLDPEAESRVPALILTGLSTQNQNHDFFSLKGSAYLSMDWGAVDAENWSLDADAYDDGHKDLPAAEARSGPDDRSPAG
jgi:ribonucleoside-diphosphate reductase beta chain